MIDPQLIRNVHGITGESTDDDAIDEKGKELNGKVYNMANTLYEKELAYRKKEDPSDPNPSATAYARAQRKAQEFIIHDYLHEPALEEEEDVVFAEDEVNKWALDEEEWPLFEEREDLRWDIIAKERDGEDATELREKLDAMPVPISYPYPFAPYDEKLDREPPTGPRRYFFE